jgi:double-stranded uracil-DNA glycosylase
MTDPKKRRRTRGDEAPNVAPGIPDLIGPELRVLFCGINPGRLSGELGLHFARAGNRFWKLLHAGGFTDRVLLPTEQATLPGMGIGITNIVERTTAAASELTDGELQAGACDLEARVLRLRPQFVAVLGLQAYRTAFRRPRAAIGEQPEGIGVSRVWLLPNPSGLQAHYQLPEMTALFRDLHAAVFGAGSPGRVSDGSGLRAREPGL